MIRPILLSLSRVYLIGQGGALPVITARQRLGRPRLG